MAGGGDHRTSVWSCHQERSQLSPSSSLDTPGCRSSSWRSTVGFSNPRKFCHICTLSLGAEWGPHLGLLTLAGIQKPCVELPEPHSLVLPARLP